MKILVLKIIKIKKGMLRVFILKENNLKTNSNSVIQFGFDPMNQEQKILNLLIMRVMDHQNQFKDKQGTNGS